MLAARLAVGPEDGDLAIRRQEGRHAELQAVVPSLSHADVMTYIQSGNVLLLHSGQAVRHSEEPVLVSARQAG